MICQRTWPINDSEMERCGDPAIACNIDWDQEFCAGHFPEEMDPWAAPLPIATRILRGIAVLLARDPFAGWTEGEMALGAR